MCACKPSAFEVVSEYISRTTNPEKEIKTTHKKACIDIQQEIGQA